MSIRYQTKTRAWMSGSKHVQTIQGRVRDRVRKGAEWQKTIVWRVRLQESSRTVQVALKRYCLSRGKEGGVACRKTHMHQLLTGHEVQKS